MKRWALLIVAVYFLMLAALSAPAVMLCFLGERPSLEDVYGFPPVWIWAGVMVLGEALLLIVPVGLTGKRQRPRRRLLIPIVTSAFFFSLLLLCAAACVYMVIWAEHGPWAKYGIDLDGTQWLMTVAGLMLLLWAFWGWVFHGFTWSNQPAPLVQRLMRWLIAGSVLELLVAVPSHIIVRRRDDCCAPAGTFFGIATGIAVMLMSFGPGVLFLYARRMGHLRGQEHLCRVCGYDLRATPERCPERGTPAADASASRT